MTTETITKEELAQALTRLYCHHPSPLSAADDIWDDVMSHREPEWQAGDVVRSAGGGVWVRTASGRWSAPGCQDSVSDNVPTRPLTRLVPEKKEA